MRLSPLLVALLILTLGIVHVTLYSLASNVPGWQGRLVDRSEWGLAFAHLQLVTAALVFVRKGLALRVVLLSACLLLWSVLVAPLSSNSLDEIVMLLSVVILTALWCGGLRFLGFQLAAGRDGESADAAGRMQFSLATLALAMSTAAVYAGLLRYAQIDIRHLSTLLVIVLQCGILGCTLLTITVHRWAWVLWAVPLVGVVLARESRTLEPVVLADVTVPIALVQSGFIGISVLVLNVAGVRLQRVAAEPSSPRSFTSS
jgi:hypothetical protein